jgi:predicted flap endonuclease-1-like 5' DNA nuclease
MELSIFLNTTFWQLFELFIWLLGSFLIGLYFGKMIPTGKEIKPKNQHFKEDELKISETKPKIRATKTFERGGKLFVNTVPTRDQDKGLNFERIGVADKKNKNNLKKIKGIGAKIELKLNKLGIYTFEQISNFNSADINNITKTLKFFPGRIERDDWVGQAFHLIISIHKKRQN